MTNNGNCKTSLTKVASYYFYCWPNNGSWVGILGILTKVAFHNNWVGIMGTRWEYWLGILEILCGNTGKW